MQILEVNFIFENFLFQNLFLIFVVISMFGGLNASSSYVAKLCLNITNHCA